MSPHGDELAKFSRDERICEQRIILQCVGALTVRIAHASFTESARAYPS